MAKSGVALDHAACLRHKLLFTHVETLVKSVNTTTGVNQLLLAGKERMAFGTNFHADLGLSGTGLDNLAAGAADYAGTVLRMDSVFHYFSPLSIHSADVIGHRLKP